MAMRRRKRQDFDALYYMGVPSVIPASLLSLLWFLRLLFLLLGLAG